MINWSKKLLISFFWCITLLAFSHTFAANGSLADSLGDNSQSWVTTITYTGVSSTSVKIQFPVFTSNGEKIVSYSVSYVKGKSIAEADLSDIKETVFTAGKVVIDSKGTVTLLLDGLSPSSKYNFVVTPVNKEWTKLDTSDAQEFTTPAVGSSAKQPGTQAPTPAPVSAPQDSTNVTDWTVLGSADTATANFTYSLSGSNVTVKWSPISWVAKFTFSTKSATESTYSSVWEEEVSKGNYSFVIGKKWLFSVKVVPIDAWGNKVGAEKVLSIKIEKVSSVTGKGLPATWPALNLILMSTFLMMLIYVVYRFRTTN